MCIRDRINNDHKTDFDKELKMLLSKVNEKFEISRISPVLKHFFCNEEGILKFNESKLSISTAGVLDSYFHTIINPSKYGKVKFSIIMNYYWACYTCIVNYMIKNNKAYFSEKLDVDVSDNNECLILSRLEEVDKIISNMEPEDFNCNDDTYYNLIRARLCDKECNYSCCGILTTNYTPYVKDCMNDESKLVYLNGRIGLFEIPDITSINTLSGTLDSNRIFFPYVIGQSYEKPIINRKQIETYHRAVHILSETDCLIIIGYGINDDDSHINALIRDFTLSKANAKVIIVCRNESENDLRKKLRTNGGKMEIVHRRNKSNSEVIADVFNLM